MMEKIAMSALIRDSISLPPSLPGRTQPEPEKVPATGAGNHLELVALGWVWMFGKTPRGGCWGLGGIFEHIFMLDPLLTPPFARRHKEQCAPF